ncbi:FMRFamide receptor-like [Ostrea edulis]|uniref:FMRFamide receptor-like n=1 Tax=Ostrea edulis TaxID=37623 RepID=UPI0024AFFE91|nr:FMRFamide receptor-like [Ostrea edulis]
MDNITAATSLDTSSLMVGIPFPNLTNSSVISGTQLEDKIDSPLELVSDEQLRLTRLIVQKCLVPIITCAGVSGNVISIAVLIHKSMKTSTNCYLTALAVFDILYLITSMTLSLKHYQEINEHWVYKYIYLYSRIFIDIWANTSVSLTVTFTVERYVVVCHPIKGRAICTPKRARIITLFVILFVVFAMSPEFFVREVYEKIELRNSTNVTTYQIEFTEMGESHGYSVYYNWLIVLVFSFAPLAVLLSFNIILIRSVCKANRLRRRMTYVAVNRPGERRSGEQTKVTCMLIGVAFVFIICQLPTAAMIIFNTYIDLAGVTLTKSGHNYRIIAGNVANILISVNAAVNFILYSVMSTKFRKVFLRMFCDHTKYTLGRNFSEYSYSTGVSSVRRISACRDVESKRLRKFADSNSHSPEELIKHYRLLPNRHRSQESLTSKESFSRSNGFSQRAYTDTVL